MGARKRYAKRLRLHADVPMGACRNALKRKRYYERKAAA